MGKSVDCRLILDRRFNRFWQGFWSADDVLIESQAPKLKVNFDDRSTDYQGFCDRWSGGQWSPDDRPTVSRIFFMKFTSRYRPNSARRSGANRRTIPRRSFDVILSKNCRQIITGYRRRWPTVIFPVMARLSADHKHWFVLYLLFTMHVSATSMNLKRAFLAHLSRRLKWAIVIAHRPSSVRPSVVRPSVWRKLSHFRLLLWNRWTEFNETWQKARSQRPLPSLCFWADRKNKMAALASDWLRHFRLLLWNHWTEFNETWQEARSQRPLPSLCFSGRSEKQDGRPGLWLAETFLTSPLKLLNGIQQNLIGSKISTPSTKFVFFRPIGKTRWPPWPLIGRDIFDFSSETAERNSTKIDRKQDLKASYQVCVFRADRKNKMAALASDWPRHFRLLLWNRWTEFNEIW